MWQFEFHKRAENRRIKKERLEALERETEAQQHHIDKYIEKLDRMNQILLTPEEVTLIWEVLGRYFVLVLHVEARFFSPQFH